VATDIAFIGRMRSGKDTAGARLVEHHGYTRLAFADPLKALVRAIDPVLYSDYDGSPIRLSDELRHAEMIGNDSRPASEIVKDETEEVRRLWQSTGEAIRALDPDFWVNRLVNSWYALGSAPVVVTDVRYRNEADALKARGFKLVRIIRPADASKPVQAMTGRDISEGIRAHRSETELANYTVDACVYNGGSLAELYQRVDALVD
jgi:hypothetical protein